MIWRNSVNYKSPLGESSQGGAPDIAKLIYSITSLSMFDGSYICSYK